MWFPVHLKGPVIPDPSVQMAELIVYITSTRVDLYSHQILLVLGFSKSSQYLEKDLICDTRSGTYFREKCSLKWWYNAC